MAINAETREQLVLQRLRDRYEHEGYSFHAYPPREFVPPFLADYHPDAIALKGDGGIVIEIRDPSMPRNVRLSEVADYFKGQKNWQFQIVNLEQTVAPLEIQPS